MKNKICAKLLPFLVLLSPIGVSAEAVAEFNLDPVIVTATKMARSLKEVSAAVQIISRDEIDAVGADNLADALSLATGVQVVGGTGKKRVNIRGFDSRFSMIMLDGRRLASEPDQLFELSRLTLANVERIEIVRGPQSALYGTEALGGIINIITKNAKEQSIDLSLDFGRYGHNSDDTQNFDFSYQSGQTGRFRYSLSASYKHNEPMYRGPGFTYEPYGQHKNFGGRVDYDLSTTETLSLNLSYQEERTNELTAYTPNNSALRRTLDNNRRNEQSLSYTKKTENTELFFRYYQGVLDKAVDQRNAVTGNLMSTTSWVRAERTMRALEGRLTRKVNDQHTFTFGVEYRPEKFRGTAVKTGEGIFSVTGPNGVAQTGNTAWLDYFGAYLMDEWSVTPKLRSIISLRYDNNNRFGNDFSPKIGLIYQFDDTARLKFNAAKAFRSPTPNQLYNTTLASQGNANLKSEKAKSFDLSYEKDFNRAGYKLTYFSNDISNLIELRPAITGGQMYQNINKASIQGIEAEYTTHLGKNLTWSNGYTYLDAIDKTTGSRLFNRARSILTSRIAYNRSEHFTLSLWINFYHDYLPSSDTSVLDQRDRSYLLWNLAANYKLNKNSKIIIGLYNIFDKRDEDTLEMGRYFHATLQLHF